MTKIKFIAFVLFTVIFASCSSGDDNNDSNNNQSTGGSFDFVYNNETKKVSSWEAKKIDDYMQVEGVTSDGIGVNFVFNVFGNLYEGSTHGTSATSSVVMHEVSEVFTSNTFTFTLEELNTVNKTVKVKFSGKLYEDGYDYEANYITDPSKFIPISGAFTVPYKDLTADIPGLGTFAKLDGKDWHGMSLDSSTELIGFDKITTLNVENDGEYSLGIVFPIADVKKGTFAFTSNDFYNRISFLRFDLATHEYIKYNVSGTITYSAVNDAYVEGTFSLTATHPVNNSKIVITNGKFKEGR
ncbi:hypothetical protein CLU83_3932 [Flavobacterium sp. 1]|uniref:hypothetical protein n=1 Tax=Flavobacterium sp. 1 TaxID=2035200 RepID=UPI000C239454|nr:hypothetical protein [Flavobacterium sp. 1]PJJ10502.1 hypothetical protein CLU83_3932 [Flavobacterium sp. 1]